VKLKIYTEKDISSAFSYLSSRARALNLGNYKIIAQEMVQSGTEIIIGGNVDQQFGKMILLGLGGVYVEIFKDVALRVCPINRYDSRSMIQQLKSSGIIAPDVRRERMVESVLLKVSRMLVENDISELDLNPIILTGNGYTAVDLMIMK
jgi:acetyltransferase